MILGNPVRGVIHPTDWQRPAGNRDWRVTQPFGCTGFKAEPPLGSCAHFHRGIDLGYGGCGRAILAAEAGRAHRSRKLASGEHIVALDHGQGWITVYGHLRSRAVAEGRLVTKGQVLGETGDTGLAIGCHLHFGVKSGASTTGSVYSDTNGKWLDPWPRLEQNAAGIDPDAPEDDMPPLTTYIPGHTTTVAKGFNIRSAPELSGTVLRTTTAPEAWTVIGWVKGAQASGSDQWLVRWAGTYEYVHKSGVRTVDPPATVDCSAEIAAATAPIQASLVEANSKIAAAQAALV